MKKAGLIFVALFTMMILFGCARGTDADAFRFESTSIDIEVGEDREVPLVLGNTSRNGTIIYHCDLVETVDNGSLTASNILFLRGVGSTYFYRDTTCGEDEVLRVTALHTGTVKITAYVKEYPNYTDTIIINVVNKKLNAYQIISDKNTITVGETMFIHTRVFPEDIPTEAIYTSSDESVLKVYSNGMLEALKPGTAIISATSLYDSSLTAKKEFTVNQVSLKSISVPETDVSIFIGDEYQLNVTYDPSEPSTGTRYVSSNPNIASVDENGVIKGLSDGTSTITISSGSKQATVNLTVIGMIENKLEFDTGTTFDLNIGTSTSQEIYYEVSPIRASQNLNVENSDSSVCEVTALDGVLTVKAIGVGTAEVKVSTKTGLYYKVFTVTVFISDSDLVTEIKVTGKAAMNVDEEQTLKVTITPNNAYDKTVTWSSSDPSIATVDEDGVVKALSAGSVTIIATANDTSGVTATLEITVSE